MNGLAGPPWWLVAIMFAAGAVAGRFLNRCADTFPRHERLRDQLAAPFRLSRAEATLRQARSFGHRLPMIGWLLPGNPLARTRGENLRRAFVELLNGLLVALLFVVEFPEGFVAHPDDPFAIADLGLPTAAGGSLALQLVRFGLHLVLVEAVLVASAIDFERMIIPDATTVPAMLLAIVVATASGGTWLVPLWYEDAGLLALLDMGQGFGEGVVVPAWLLNHPHWHGLFSSLAGLIAGGGIVWAVRLIGHWALGREAMGFGDVTLMAMIGSIVGWQPVLVVFFLAPVTAVGVVLVATIAGSNREFPFGPWLSMAAVLLLVGWQAIWPAAGRFFLMGRVLAVVALAILILLAVFLRGWRMLRGDERWYAEDAGDWTSADQLAYQSRENADTARHGWKGRFDGEWPGIAAGRGAAGLHRWRQATPVGTRRWPVRRQP